MMKGFSIMLDFKKPVGEFEDIESKKEATANAISQVLEFYRNWVKLHKKNKMKIKTKIERAMSETGKKPDMPTLTTMLEELFFLFMFKKNNGKNVLAYYTNELEKIKKATNYEKLEEFIRKEMLSGDFPMTLHLFQGSTRLLLLFKELRKNVAKKNNNYIKGLLRELGLEYKVKRDKNKELYELYQKFLLDENILIYLISLSSTVVGYASKSRIGFLNVKKFLTSEILKPIEDDKSDEKMLEGVEEIPERDLEILNEIKQNVKRKKQELKKEYLEEGKEEEFKKRMNEFRQSLFEQSIFEKEFLHLKKTYDAEKLRNFFLDNDKTLNAQVLSMERNKNITEKSKNEKPKKEEKRKTKRSSSVKLEANHKNRKPKGNKIKLNVPSSGDESSKKHHKKHRSKSETHHTTKAKS